ncbi:MAG: von Willebrand factor type A domain-containing protein [Prevotellaceae bacterium]|jgi:Ca-activated chloride channel family protein|nr:von Willebrand factor type A domain-containing protein [Prevotellaceae bacterium]
MKKMILLLVGIAFMGYTMNSQATLRISGQVSDDSGPLAGVSVSVKGTNTVVITDTAGWYVISASPEATLIFAFLGMKTQQIAVNGRTTINVVMQPYEILLDEVVVVGYGIQRKSVISIDRPVMEYQAEYRNMSADAVYVVGGVNYDDLDKEEYGAPAENKFISPLREPLSTFSADVDVASYANIRRYIHRGQIPPSEAVRTEELINYFTWHYPPPKDAYPVSVTTEAGACPWNAAHRLVRIGIRAREIDADRLPASNLVFLIDVSGSMDGPTRLGLVKASLKLLVNNLRAKDRVAIVVYAGSAGEVLPSTPGNDRPKIREALDNLSAGGSTAGGAGIKLAYKIARQNFIKNGNNRIILCTDGDFNVGVASEEELGKLIEEERRSGVFLTVLGYGMGNYKDRKMQTLAQKGNGNHAYIDNLQEANKTLVEQFGSTVYAVAKDVKLQVEFNPAKVQAYRLIGYETRLLNPEDFNDDTKDAGEMGAGHTVTALYEVVPAGVESDFVGRIDALKYQSNDTPPPALSSSPEMLTVKVRYKEPDKDTSKKIEQPLIDEGSGASSDDFRFTAAVALFGHLLRHSDYVRNASYRDVIELAGAGLGDDPSGYRHEFVQLVKTVEGMTK